MGIHRQKEDFLRKKKVYCVPFSEGVSVIIITVKNRPRISLVKLVVSILT